MEPWVTTTLSYILVTLAVLGLIAVLGVIIFFTGWAMRAVLRKHVEKWREQAAIARKLRTEHDLEQLDAEMQIKQMKRNDSKEELEASFDHKYNSLIESLKTLKSRYKILRDDLTNRHEQCKSLNSRCVVLAAELRYATDFINGFCRPLAAKWNINLGEIIPNIPTPPPIFSFISHHDNDTKEAMEQLTERCVLLSDQVIRADRRVNALEEHMIEQGMDIRSAYAKLGDEDAIAMSIHHQLFGQFMEKLTEEGGSSVKQVKTKQIEKTIRTMVDSMDQDDMRAPGEEVLQGMMETPDHRTHHAPPYPTPSRETEASDMVLPQAENQAPEIVAPQNEEIEQPTLALRRDTPLPAYSQAAAQIQREREPHEEPNEVEPEPVKQVVFEAIDQPPSDPNDPTVNQIDHLVDPDIPDQSDLQQGNSDLYDDEEAEVLLQNSLDSSSLRRKGFSQSDRSASME